MPADGGAPALFLKEPGFGLQESADGRFLYWMNGKTGDIWRQALKDGAPSGSAERMLTGLQEGDRGNWALGKSGVYYIARRAETHDAAVQYRDFERGVTRTIHLLTKPPLWEGPGGLAVAPDESVVLFVQLDHGGSNIFIQ